MLTVDGLATGLDTGRIIEGLLEIQQAQIDRFNGRKQEIVDQQTAFRTVEARLLDFQSSLSGLRRFSDNIFQRKQATSTDEAVAVSVSNDAIPGVYTLKVDALAQAHQIASNTFSVENEQIAKGEFTFQVGSGDLHTITIDDGNNTLDALAREINEARGGVTAGILYDGSAYRLLLTGSESGAANLISVTYAPDAQDPSAVPTFDLQNPVQDATDASVVFGSGGGAITVTNSTNQVDESLPGVTLDLLESDPAKPITIRVASDTEPAREAIEQFVESYNGLMEFIDEQQQFNPETGEASLLFGNRSLRTIRDTVALEVSGVVPDLDNTAANRLSAIGIGLDSRNRLTIRSGELTSALEGNLEGVEIEDIQKLFGLHGETTNPEIRFISASDETHSTLGTPYRADITQTAERAQIVAPTTLAASTTIDATNDEFMIAIDGDESEVLKLAHGSYTPQELADHLADVINSQESLADVAISLENNALEISSIAFGSSSGLEIMPGTSLSVLGFTAGQQDNGQDVVGKYVLEDGTTESATGSGQFLLGDLDDGATKGLRIRVTAAEGLSGLTADVDVSRGIASTLNQTVNSFFANEQNNKGAIAQVNETFNGQIDSIDLSIDRLNARFEAEQQSLIRQFAQLETAVSELQSTGNLLAAQLASLPQIGIQG